MSLDVKTTESHETVYEGRIAGDDFKRIVIEAIKRELGVSHQIETFDLELTIGTMCMPTVWPDADFSLTKDHLWWRKSTPSHEQ